MAYGHRKSDGRPAVLPLGLLLAVVALGPWRAAHAYIDPNSAGSIYQLLFPLLIAAASMLAALRRYIARLWHRLVTAVVTAVRGERPRGQSDPDG